MEKLVCNWVRFSRFLKGIHLRISLTESERSDRFKPGKFLKMIEHVNYPIRYCTISFLVYAGSSSLSNAWRFFTHPVVIRFTKIAIEINERGRASDRATWKFDLVIVPCDFRGWSKPR